MSAEQDDLREREELRESLVRLEQALEIERRRRLETEAQLEALTALAAADGPERLDAILGDGVKRLLRCEQVLFLEREAGESWSRAR